MIALFLTHWFQFNYAPKGQPWYYGADWPNVFVILPLFFLGMIPFLWHHYAVKDLHRKIDALAEAHSGAVSAHEETRAIVTSHLRALVDALDPDTDGGIAVVRAQLDKVADAVDAETPGGIRVIVERLDKLKEEA